MEAQFACADLSSITDEDLLRKMWQQAEDFSRKKEIRAYMYKLREQRLKEFYTSNDSSPPYFLMDNASATFGLKKSTVTGSHGDSLVDQSFESFKTKEIRDSESPTRFGNMAIPSDNSGWQIRTSEEVSEDGKTHTMRTTATTQGIKEIDGGRTAFAGKNLESHSEHYDGDESNFVHSKGDQSTTVLVEDSVTEDENGRSVSGSTHSTTTSVSRTRVVHQQQNGDSERPSKSVADAAGLSSATTVDFGDDHFSSSQKRTVTSSTSSSVLGNSASTKNTEHSTTNRMDKQTMSGKVEDERMAPKELSKDPERVREAFRLAQGSGKIIEREETMVNTTTKMITETKRLDDGTTVTTRTYEKIGHEPTSANDKLEQETLSSTTKRQQEAVGRSGRMDDSSATNDFIRQEKANQSSTSTTTKTSSQRIMVEVDAAHDSFARSLRSVSPTGSIRSVRSNATLPGRASTSPEKTQPLRTDLDTKPDYMRSTFTSERKVSGYQEQQSLPTQRSPSPRKVSETTLHTGSRSTSPTKITTAAASTAVEYEKTSQCQTHKTESEQMDYPEVDGVKARSSTKPPLVRSETYEERCRKILGMSNRPVEEDTKGESKSIFSTYDNTVTVQQSRSELREQRKKIEQEIKSMESKTMKSSTARHVTDEQDSVVEKEHASSRKPSLVTKESSTRKLSSQQTSPTRKPSPTPKESSPIRKGLAQADSSPTKAPTKEGSPSGKAPLREISPTVKEMSPTKTSLPEEDNLTARKSPTKAPSPTRVSPTKDSSPTRHSSAVIDVSSKLKSSQTETTTVRTSPTKETSPTRKPARDVSPLKNERVASPKKPFPETTTKSKATILVEQKQDGRNISVAEITILPVMEVSENVRTKTTTSRTHEKILTKQSSDTKFDRRSTMAANSRVITNKSSSDFDVKRRAAELATQSKTRSTATSPDKRRPTSGVEKPAPVKQNHITVAKIKIESMRKPNAQTKSTHATNEETTSVRSSTKRTSEQVIVSKRPVEPDTDPESSKDTGISDNSEVEETVESVIEMNVTGTSCCRHTDRKDSAPVYRTTAVTRTGKNYSRSSSDNHLRATNASANRQTTNQTTLTSKSTVSDRSANGGRKADRPVKHVATKTINLASKAVSDVNALSTTCSSTLGSDHLDNVVIDIQLAKSSREPTPNKLIPIPVSPDTEDTGKPRYPDAVLEPEDDTSASRQSRTQRVNKIPIFEEATNEYVGCEITEVDEATSQHATRITNLDRVTEDDESLLSVTEKVNKFAQEARRLQESSNSGIAEERPQPARFAVRPEYDDIDEHLKSDECLLSVSDKVTKFISTAEEVKKIRTSGPFVPENEDAPVKVSEGDECLLSVNEKVNRFANRIQRTSESREHDTFSSSGGRLQTSVGNDQLQQKMEEEEEDYVEEEEKVAEKKPQTNSVPESVSSKFAPQKSPELVKNAMRSTARHIVQDAAHEDLAQAGGSSIANRYRTSTMSKQFEKQTPATVAPCTSPIILRSTEAVKKAKEIFEKGQTVQDARQRDILNRPSIWEDRRNKQNQPQQQQTDQKPADVKLTDIGVTERKSNQAMREDGRDTDGLLQRKESVTKVERVQESETTKPASSHGRRDSGSGVRPPAYIRDTVSSKKDLFEKRISSSKMQVEYTTQTSQEATETLATTTTRRQSLKQVDTSAPSSTGRPIHAGDQSKPSYMNHTVASLEHINANQRRDSLDHGVQAHHESTTTTARNSITGSAKFGIELKRADTSNRMTTSSVQSNVTSSKRKASAGDGQPASTVASSPVIEDIFDLEMLERMLESVTGYEQRRRIRAQIRVVKKQREQQPSFVSLAGKQATVTSVKNSTTTHSTTVTNGRESSSGKRKDSSPTRSSTSTGRKQSSTTTDATDTGSKSNAIFETDTMISKQRQQHQQQQQNQEHENARNDKTNVINSSKTATVVTDRLTTKTGATDRHATTKDDRPIWATSNILKKASENTRTFKSSSVTSSSATTGTGGRKVVSSSSSYQQVKSKTDPKTTTDCITSSYGVGPTDENGLPLFGIRALKKKAAPVPAATEDTKISGTIITETLYAENGGPAVGKRSTTHYSNEPGTFSDFVRSDGGHEIFGDDGLASKQKGTGKLMAIRKTETIDAAGTHSEELEVMDGSEMRSKVVRKGSVKELTERFIHRESSGSLTQESTRTYPKAGLILRSSGHSQSSRASTPATDRCSMQSGSVDEFEQDHLEAGVTTREARSFLNDTSKIVDVRDVLQRMSNADNVTEQGDTAEDQEARALLNKFLGASVLMSGVESMVSSTGSMLSETASVPFTTATATKKVSKVSSTTTKTQTVKSSGATPSISPTKQATVDNLDDNWDEAVLKKLLESTTNYDDRRKIRARIRQVMAEKEACADIVAIVTADLQRERQLQQQSTSATASTSVTPDRPSAPAATVANGLSQVQQTTTRTIANTKMESQDGSAVATRTTVTTKTVASSPKPMSPFAKFRQLDKQNSISSQSPPNSPKTPTPTTPSGAMGPMFKFTDPALNRRAATVKDQLLQWCQMKTKEYENVKIENFSTSWSDGMAFCALVHHFLPDAFDFSKLTPQQRRHNFTLAFRVADEKAGIAPLLDVDDMVAMRKPDWKCVFTYVQSIYRRFKNDI